MNPRLDRLYDALCGLLLGIAQAAVLLPRLGRLALGWPVALAAIWALGWVTSTSIGIRVEEQFTVFGSSGALVATALTGVLPLLLHRRAVPAEQPPAGHTDGVVAGNGDDPADRHRHAAQPQRDEERAPQGEQDGQQQDEAVRPAALHRCPGAGCVVPGVLHRHTLPERAVSAPRPSPRR